MNIITRTATALALSLAAVTITVAQADARPAQAAECVYGNGYQMCFDSNGNNNWDVSVRNNHGTENMTVQCNGKSVSSYDSYGPFSKSEANYMASYFCSL